jgi:hypothetical protein
VRLAYFHANRLLTGLYKQETEIGTLQKTRRLDRKVNRHRSPRSDAIFKHLPASRPLSFSLPLRKEKSWRLLPTLMISWEVAMRSRAPANSCLARRTWMGAVLVRPRPMCPRPKILGCCIPWTKCSLAIVPLTKQSHP